VECSLASVGLTSGYFKHRRRGEKPCRSCTDMFLEHKRLRRDQVPCVDCGELHPFVAPGRGRPRDRCASCQRKAAAAVKSERARQRRLPVGPVRRRNSETVRYRTATEKSVYHPPLNGSLFVFGPCGWCGESFLALAGSWETRSLYCSRNCSKQADRSRRGRFSVPPKVRAKIYERDGWVCQLCEEPVDPGLDPSDPWAATLDHIVPRSHQLVPDDSVDNLQLAHRWCNSVKGDLRFYDESVLKAG